MQKGSLLSTVCALSLLAVGAAKAQDQTLLLRDPAVSQTKIAFIYAGDLWTANRDGSAPRRLTSSPVEERNPVFSPDGTNIAYTADYENNDDVYVMSVNGGQPTRLTWHPGADTVLDWAPDGSAVAFASARERLHGRSAQLYHVSVNGGLPEKQMEARIERGVYNADATRFAYIPHRLAYNGIYGGSSGWRGYRGGASPSIIIYDKSADSAVEVPGERVNDIEPMWVGDQVYFVSDREDKVLNLFHYNPATKAIRKVSNETVWDIRAADAHDGVIVYEAGGRLKEFTVASGATREIRVSINPDLPQLRPQWKNASGNVESAALSPSGKRVAVTARGDVYTVPVKDGSTRNLTGTDGAREYTALWSPDGQRLAYIDASSEEQRLVLEDQSGLGATRSWPLGADFHFLIDWGGEGQRIIYQNHRLQLYAIDVANGRKTLISTGARRDTIEADTSPDGRWLAYTEEKANFNRDLMLHDFSSGRRARISDGIADVSAPVFSHDGQYLYFAASTNSGPGQVGLDLSSQEKPYRAGLYAVVLAADSASPFKPKPGDEEGDSKKDDDKNDDDKPKATKVDLNGLSERIVALPVAERNYDNLAAAKDGALYYVQNVQPGALNTPPGEQAASENQLIRFDFEEKEAASLMSEVNAVSVSADGAHLLISMADGSMQTAETGESLEAEPVKLGGVRALIDPQAEWAQIFDEVWRMEKAYFYDPNMHGLDWKAVYDRYKPLVSHVGRREDLNALIVEMIAEMQVGHNRAGGGDIHRPEGAKSGLLGADIRLQNGRHRIARIYTGENWNPFLKAPLAEPGLGVEAGDYILAVNGRNLGAGDNIFEFLQGAVDEQVTLRIADSAAGAGARDIVVEPTDSENAIRLWAWVEENRRAVDEATDGRVGYVYLPNTAGAGYSFFNRMFFAQVDKDAMIIDERSNGGGQAANYVTDVLSRTYLSGWKDRDGLVYNTPGGAIYGPKVMLIDQDAGSGGDFLPYAFREEGIGPLIGKRTWGGLIGIFANPLLIDGGFLSVPFFRFFDTDGNWTIENEGTAPDIDVALDPVATNKGRDTQLERAIEEIERLLQTNPSPVRKTAPPVPTELGK